MTGIPPDDSAVKATLAGRLAEVNARISAACSRAGRRRDCVRLVAVTKTATVEQSRAISMLGVRDLGENRAQVLQAHVDAAGAIPEVRWHMIGHLQRNKVKDVLRHAAVIQSVDSLRLAREIQDQAQKAGKRVAVLIEVNAGEESQKCGARPGEAMDLARATAAMSNLELQGIMSMAPLTDDVARIRSTFVKAREIFNDIRQSGVGGGAFGELSMGMSSDFEIAIEEGATIVRIGSALFAPADA